MDFGGSIRGKELLAGGEDFCDHLRTTDRIVLCDTAPADDAACADGFRFDQVLDLLRGAKRFDPEGRAEVIRQRVYGLRKRFAF